jgi:hypothetical protein
MLVADTLAISVAIVTVASLTVSTPAAAALSSATLQSQCDAPLPPAPVDTEGQARPHSVQPDGTPAAAQMVLKLQHSLDRHHGPPPDASAATNPSAGTQALLTSSSFPLHLAQTDAPRPAASCTPSSPQGYACSTLDVDGPLAGCPGGGVGTGNRPGLVGSIANSAGVPSISGRALALVQAWLGGVAVDGKDRAVDIIKNLDNQLDNALSGVAAQVMGTLSGSVPVDSDEAKWAHELVQEAVTLIEQV